MAQALMLAPAGIGVGLKTAVLGLFHAMDRQGIKVHFFKPIAENQTDVGVEDRTVALLQGSCEQPIGQPLSMREAEHLVSSGRGDELLEEIVARYEQSRPADQRYYVSDVSLFATLAGWQPKTTVRSGVELLYRWMRDAAGSVLDSERAVLLALAGSDARG